MLLSVHLQTCNANMNDEHNCPSMHAFICVTSSDSQRFLLHAVLQSVPAGPVLVGSFNCQPASFDHIFSCTCIAHVE